MRSSLVVPTLSTVSWLATYVPIALLAPVICAECLHGMWMPWDNAKAATLFPQPIGLAATWDTDFMHDVASIISEEMRAINNEQYKQDKTYRRVASSQHVASRCHALAHDVLSRL